MGKLPECVIITDDQQRARTLVAHHLEYSTTLTDSGDFSISTGSYKGKPLAVASTGLGRKKVIAGLSELIKLGAKEVVYISTCLSTTKQHDIQTVILAAGGSKKLADKANAAAARNNIKTYNATVHYLGDTRLDEGSITDEVTEAFYKLAAKENIEALSLLTVSENTITGAKMEIYEKRSRLYPASRLVFEIFIPD